MNKSSGNLRHFLLVSALAFTGFFAHQGADARTGQLIAVSANNEQAQIKSDIDRLFILLANAPDKAQAQAIENEIWKNWTKHPLPEIRKLIKDAMEARRWYDFEKARLLLNQVIEKAPDYAEGWNQRAFILFLQEKLDQSLNDIERTLELEPRHFGAMAGMARILMRQGRFATAQTILKKAIRIHPYLRARALIIKTQEQDL